MELRFTQLLAGLRTAQRFLDANTNILGSLNTEGGRRDFDVVTARLAKLAQEQDIHRTSATGELSNERALARTLRREHMQSIVRVARWKVPAAAQLAAVKLPLARSNSTELANRGRAMGAAVEPFRQLLIDGGLPADFLEQLYAASGALEEAVGKKQDHQVGRVGATENIDGEVSDACLQLNVMDALVRRQVGEHEPKLAEWAQIVRVARGALRTASSKPSGGTATPAPPPAPTSPAAVVAAIHPVAMEAPPIALAA